MSERAIKMGLCAEQVPSSSLKRTSLNRPSAKHKSSKPSRILLNWSSVCRSWSILTNFCCPEVAASLRIENKSGMSRNSAAWKQNLMSYLNRQYSRYLTFVYLLKMDYVPKIDNFGLKMTVKIHHKFCLEIPPCRILNVNKVHLIFS